MTPPTPAEQALYEEMTVLFAASFEFRLQHIANRSGVTVTPAVRLLVRDMCEFANMDGFAEGASK